MKPQLTFVLLAAMIAAVACCESNPEKTKTPQLSHATSAQNTAKPLYELRQGKVFLPGWDDQPPSAPLELLRLRYDEFEKPAHLYRERAYLTHKPFSTRALRIPKGASEMLLMARATQSQNVFPWIEVLVRPSEPASASPQLIHQGYILTESMEAHSIALPRALQGKQVRIEFKIANYSDQDDGMSVAIAYLAFR